MASSLNKGGKKLKKAMKHYAEKGYERKYVVPASSSVSVVGKKLSSNNRREQHHVNDIQDIPPNMKLMETRDDSLKRVFELEEWLSSYHGEQEIFNSFAVFSEVRLREAFNVTQQVGLPSPQRTAVCCEILCKIAKIFGRFNGIITLIAYELMRGTYYGFDHSCIVDIETSSGVPLKPYKGVPKGVHLDVHPERIMHWTPYFTLVKNLQSEIKIEVT